MLLRCRIFQEALRCTRNLWLVVLALACWAAMPQARAQSASAEYPRPAYVTVAMDDNYPPYAFRDEEGRLQGVVVDLWQLWSKKTGVPVKLHATEWGRAQQAVRSGLADVLDTAFLTGEREKWLQFSQPYASLATSIFFHQSLSGIRTVQDLNGLTVGVKAGGATTELLKAQGVENLRPYPSYEALVEAAIKGEVQVFCMENAPALYFLFKSGREGEFRHTEPVYTGKFHWGTRLGNEPLHRFIEQGYMQISEVERRAIDERWKGATISGWAGYRYARYILYILLVACALAALLVLLNWTLRRKVRDKTSELSQTLDALRVSERYNRMLFESAMLGMMLQRFDGRIVDANRAFLDMLGYSAAELAAMTVQQLTPPAYAASDQQQREALVSSGSYVAYEKEYLHRSGAHVPVRITATLVERAGERFILSTIENITEQKAAEARINFLAFHDALTALPNRLVAQARFEQAAANADSIQAKVALLVFDLDNFKTINDTLGHSVGDGLLRAVAGRMTECLHDTDTLSRQGGDEFLIVLPALDEADAVVSRMVNVMNRLQQPFEIDGRELNTTVSVGVAIYPDDGRDFATLMKNADIAMYQAKDAGRNAYRFFDERMHADAIGRMSLGISLRRAIEREELELHYQPFVDLDSGQVLGAEALLRWNHPEHGLVSPARFIPVAEDTGLIVPIGEWVLREACKQAVQWQRAGWPALQIAVNLSAVQFRRNDVEQAVLGALESSQIDPTLLELELTESILLTETENVLATVRRLKSLGVKLSIDDFGTGYSSLSYLKRFAVDKLKIDRSFVRDLINDPDDAAIVRAVIQMARSLGLKTIAEGVEEQSTLERLRLFHCDQAQGFVLAKPMPAAAFTEFLRGQQ